MYKSQYGITLLELIVAIAFMAVLVLGIGSIDMFGRSHAITADRRAKLQNEVSFLLEHMAKNIGMAIGNTANITNPVVNTTSTSLQVRIDVNQNGQNDTGDSWIEYDWNNASGVVSYCGNCTSNNPCPSGCAWENVSSRVSAFNCNYNSSNNYINVNITACWDFANSSTCGDISAGNPQVSMNSRINMPSVSTN